MLIEYIQAAMHRAKYQLLEDGTYFGRIPRLSGVWANEGTLEACRDELRSVLEGWILPGVRLGHKISVVDGININVRTAA